ncbi:hypothetical protein EYF80_016401 [Liparis tanakae]|uniref:Uncharacterized protein n=1 Tax=Liparis tanakae TaxID=230148 RepID=A0A4Z2I5Z2_9TELE|nr:hypothetical protein EYF80_016401 [Liparis tanakae]
MVQTASPSLAKERETEKPQMMEERQTDGETERSDMQHTPDDTRRGGHTNLMFSSQMEEPSSGRVVLRMVRLTSGEVSLIARLNATDLLKANREDISEQTAVLLPSIKPPDNQLFEKGRRESPSEYLSMGNRCHPDYH